MRHNGMDQAEVKSSFNLCNRGLLFAIILLSNTLLADGFLEDPTDEADVIGVRIDTKDAIEGYG